jgi:cytochrome c biogenesis protein CcdA
MKSTTLHKYQELLFDLFIYISYFLIIMSALGISETVPKYLYNLDYYVRVYICLFLMWRFNPLRSHSALNQYLVNFKDEIKKLF